MTWDQNGQVAQLELQLNGERGTDSYADQTGTGMFRGAIDRSKTECTITGNLTLNY